MGSLTLDEALDRADTDDAIGRLKVRHLPGVPARRGQGQGPPHHGGDRHRREPPGQGPRRPAAPGAAPAAWLSRSTRPHRAGPAPHHRRLRPRRGRQGHHRRRARRAGPAPLAEPVVDDPGPPRPASRRRLRRSSTARPFEARIARRRVPRVDRVPGNYYGTPTPEVPLGQDLVLEIEVDGARQIKALQPDALLIFVLPPSREEQQRRLRGPGRPARQGGASGCARPRTRSPSAWPSPTTWSSTTISSRRSRRCWPSSRLCAPSPAARHRAGAEP